MEAHESGAREDRPAHPSGDFIALDTVLRRLENVAAHVVADSAGVIEVWNPPAEALLGWTSAEACGHTLEELIVPHHLRQQHRDGLQRWQTMPQTAGVVDREFEAPALQKDGGVILIHIHVQIVVNEQGTRFLGWLQAVNHA